MRCVLGLIGTGIDGRSLPLWHDSPNLWTVPMARNVVQFQKGLSEPEFERRYGTEEQCRAIVIASRWPKGFECPICGPRSIVW
jgi:hypothetical protein